MRLNQFLPKHNIANCFSRLFQNPELNQFRQNMTLSRSLFTVKSHFFSKNEFFQNIILFNFHSKPHIKNLSSLIVTHDFKLYTLKSGGGNVILFFFSMKKHCQREFLSLFLHIVHVKFQNTQTADSITAVSFFFQKCRNTEILSPW